MSDSRAGPLAWWFRIPFWQRVLGGFALGALAGWAFGPDAETWFQPLGDLYITLIKMIAVPLVFFAVIHAIGSLHGQKSVAALGGGSRFAITALLAVCVGLAVGTIFQPGAGMSGLTVDPKFVPKDIPSPVQVLLSIVPSNPFHALTGIGTTKNAAGETVLAAGKRSILPVIFFAGLIGFAMVKLGEKVPNARKLAGEASEIMIQITRFVLEHADRHLRFDRGAGGCVRLRRRKSLPFGSFVLALYLACALHIVVVYGGLLLAHGLNPWKFFRGAAPGMQVAFVSSSSFASLPVSIRSVTHNLGVDKDYASFAVPLGASIKMDGCGAIYPALCAVFIAQYTGMPLSMEQIFHRDPGLGAGQFRHRRRARHRHGDDRSVECRRPAAGSHRLLVRHRPRADMMRTMTNVTGQMLVPVLVAKQTGLLDKAVYDAASTNVGIEDERAA